ncbi:DMT family transporter [Roseococcus sp. SYP-B2431]|uniref:DMT family transporter n=1 Tax=Roseococcus sp. SYP-B2431 TaxID=2496640 RepID=UPI001039FBBE|nr:DMT family transporter [Roseococcus sp. SYP-B2431]TCH99383.1 DMT family transporter [Roseococcus sp. SYP-B2431]
MTPRTTGLLLLLATTVNWGATWPLLKFIMTELPPLTLRAWGAGAAALLLIAITKALGVPLAVPRSQRVRLGLYALLNVTAWMALGTLALRWLSASEGAILAYTMPIWTALFAWPILGERPGLGRMAGLLIGFGSVAVLFAGRGAEVGIEKLPGMALILASAVLFAMGSVLSKRMPLRLPPLSALTWQMALGAIPMLALAPFLEHADVGAVSGAVWFWFGWMVIFSMGLSYFTWFGALARLPASTAALGTLLAPVLSVVGAAVVLGEPLGLRELGALGGVAVAVTLAITQPERHA